MRPKILSIASFAALAALVTVSGCSKDEAKAKAKPDTTKPAADPDVKAPDTAKTTATNTVAGASRLADAGGDYDFDSAHTQVLFRVDHLGVSHQFGRFNKTTGTLTIDAADISKSTVSLEIATASVFTADEKRDKHLRSPDFFDAKQFPAIKFTSTAVAANEDGTYAVTGKLDLHGVTKTITIPLEHVGSGKDPWDGFRSGFYASFSINRGDYGMSFMEGALGNEIQLMVSIEAIRK